MTTSDWRDRYEEKTADGHKVLNVFQHEGKDVGVYTELGSIVSVHFLIPKSKPVTYRPYRFGEVKCGDVFVEKYSGNQKMVTMVGKEGVRFTEDRNDCEDLFNDYIKLDGTPAGEPA